MNNISLIKNKIKCLPWNFLSKYGFYKGSNVPIKFIIENADWAIKFVGQNIKKEIGWTPKIDIKIGIKEMKKNIQYWKDAPLWTKSKIKSATKDWFKYLKNE